MMILDKDIHDTGLKSHWIDVSSEENDFRGNLSIKESECLKSLLNNELKNIKNKKSKISIISPFRDVVNGLNNALKDLDIGTIHTMQGKQKDIIILVLGGGNGGARNWAAQKPNLLNVALTRAKENIFIIGDKQKWGVLPYFKEALFQLESDKI
ncbi:AAA domain-containing protein [Campylobacter fetus]|nr:AAA domain-containing protein [Campylobacter fetus]